MQAKDKKFNFLNKTVLQVVGILLIVVSAIFLLAQKSKVSVQSIPASALPIRFVGEYRIGDGEWKEIVEGEHISSTKGDVTLRGRFYEKNKSGEFTAVKNPFALAVYANHVNLTFCEVGKNAVVKDHESAKIGESACGKDWVISFITNPNETIEIIIHNPHKFGNENAVDEMLDSVTNYAGLDSEKAVLESGKDQRIVGLFFMIASVMFLGTALFASLIRAKSNKIIWLLGLIILFAGVYILYSSKGINYWSSKIIFNTRILGISMVFYAFFVTMLITAFLTVTKKIGVITCVGSGVVNTAVFVLTVVTKTYFYDALLYWIILQNVVNIILTVCLIKEFIQAKDKYRYVYIGAILPLVSFGGDSVATWLGIWEGGAISRLIFIIFFVGAMVVLFRIIPKSINAVEKAKGLETEKLVLKTQLTESRISTMMSQIRPHFIYNTLGSIEQLCELDPLKAGELVHNFAKYLRGNFGELDNPKPILMSQEMEHVHHYINIENVRFPDMTFTFEMKSNDFHIPALTIQPIVENAIKHGLMKLSKGGTIKVVSYETDKNYCVLVEDNGVGFDTSVLLDERGHLGIRNIRGRLSAMVNGTLEIDSAVGEGTKVLISIPKEVNR